MRLRRWRTVDILVVCPRLLRKTIESRLLWSHILPKLYHRLRWCNRCEHNHHIYGAYAHYFAILAVWSVNLPHQHRVCSDTNSAARKRGGAWLSCLRYLPVHYVASLLPLLSSMWCGLLHRSLPHRLRAQPIKQMRNTPSSIRTTKAFARSWSAAPLLKKRFRLNIH